MHRRTFLRSAAALGGAARLTRAQLDSVLAEPAQPGDGPYGPYLPGGDANGVGCPEGFTSRIVARAGEPVAASSYTWHRYPDGGATFAAPGGGWVYTSNSEVPSPNGGVGAIRFDAAGEVVDAHRILDGTRMNCAGGKTPWDTWLSCEEIGSGSPDGRQGQVYECDPFQAGQGEVRPALGAFSHEAVSVDPVDRVLYLTEDNPTGRLYRFVPDRYPSLEAGTLQVARLDGDGVVDWLDIADPHGSPVPTSLQQPESTAFDGGEGIYRDDRWIYFSTKGDDRIWAFDLEAQRIVPLYAAGEHRDPPLFGVDNVIVSSAGDVYVAEDGGDLRMSIITADTLEVAPVIGLFGPDHVGSEVAGLSFSPDGSRLYFASQRGPLLASAMR